MAKYNKYDISGSSYTQGMEEKQTRYNNLIRQAERINYSNNGAASKEEAELYYQAAKVCEEIMNMNLSQRAVYAKWELFRQTCESAVKRICDAIAPPPPAPEPKDTARTADISQGPKPEKSSGQTASGFKTKNAVRDVPAETIEGWYQEKPRHGFDDITGMDELKKRLIDEAAGIGWSRIDEALDIGSVQSYFFYGPPGTGKTYLIEAFASELMEKGFKYIRLLGGDIHASLVGVAEKTVQIAFKEAIDNEPCLIFIDEIEDVCVDRNSGKAEGHEKRLTVAFLEAFNLLWGSKKRVIFMGATNHPGQVDSAMLDRPKLIPIPLPDEAAREAWFARKLNMLTLEEGFSYADMAAATDNYSYRDLTRLQEAVAFKAKRQVIEAYRVETSSGELDQEQTDIAGSSALVDGAIVLTRALFDEAREENPPSYKAGILEELRIFEENISKLKNG